jgi:hypothetical protein
MSLYETMREVVGGTRPLINEDHLADDSVRNSAGEFGINEVLAKIEVNIN